MDILTLLKYFNCHTTEQENREIQSWLASDVDGSHHSEYSSAHMLYNGLMLHGPTANKFIREEKSSTGRTWKNLILACVSAAAIVLFAVGLWSYSQDLVYNNLSNKMLCANVPDGQTFEMILEDGTSMFMNSGTKVMYPVSFSKNERKVKLVQGEVFFDVTKDQERPFVVETFASDIKVLGTKFNVEANPQMQFCSTALLEGSVKLESKENDVNVVLEPNMIALFDHGRLTVDKMSDLSSVADWTKGMIDIQGMKFDSLMSKYEKAFNVNIVIERDDIPEISYTRGKVRISDGIEHALAVLQMASDFEYERDFETNVIYIR